MGFNALEHTVWTFILLPQLALIAVVDLRSLHIPNGLNALLALSGLGFVLTKLEAAHLYLVAAAVALLLAWGLQLTYERCRGWAGLGTGDVMLIEAPDRFQEKWNPVFRPKGSDLLDGRIFGHETGTHVR